MSGITCSRSHSTSQACSIGALTVNWLAIFILCVLSGAAVLDESVANQSPVVGRLSQRPQAEQCGLGRIGQSEVCNAERHQSGDPVDGLGHTRWLVQVEIAC